jgi:hypothetical protein
LQCYRVDAEKIYAATVELVAEQAATTTAAQTTINDTTLKQLRKELDKILVYQADRAPSWVSLEGAEYPEREGSIKDFLAAREMSYEPEMFEEDEGEEESDDEVDETSDDKTVDVQTGVSLGMGETSSGPESAVAAVEKGPAEHGDEQVIAEKLHNLTLDREIKEASPASKEKLKMQSKSKAKEVMSVKNLVASPQKIQQSHSSLQASGKPHWRPWE